VRSIGVSNFGVPHLNKLAQTATVPPAVNQIELSPFLQRRELAEHCRGQGIVLEVLRTLCPRRGHAGGMHCRCWGHAVHGMNVWHDAPRARRRRQHLLA
jgi:diketogulonate reductase-like aldo/keto reductase